MLAEKHIQHVTCLNEDDCRLIRESLAQIGKNPPGVQPKIIKYLNKIRAKRDVHHGFGILVSTN